MSSVQNPPSTFVVRNEQNYTGRHQFLNGYYMDIDSNGYLGVFRPDGTELVFFTGDRVIFVGQNGNKNLEINLNNQSSPLIAGDMLIRFSSIGNLFLNAGSNGNLFLNSDVAAAVIVSSGNGLQLTGIISLYKGIYTVGYGLSPIYGLDNRKGITSVDASAITLYTTTGSGQVYKLKARLNITAGTSPSASYTLKWTENGTVISQVLSASAVNTPANADILIQPDSGTAITAQITAISGTGTTVNVAAEVEQVA